MYAVGAVSTIAACSTFTNKWVVRFKASDLSGLDRNEALLAHVRAIHAVVKQEYGWPHMHKERLARGIRVGNE